MAKRGPKPKQLIDTTWRPELAYVVGLIATDGCLLNDGRHIDFTSEDIQLIETFQSVLGLHHIHIGTKIGTYAKKPCPRIQFGSVLFYRWLVTLGLTPNKSKTIGPLTIPDEYFFDFLRGCLDGDGTMYAFGDARWRSSYTYFLSLASASCGFLEWIQSTILRLEGVKGSIQDGARVYELRFAKAASASIFRRLYEDETSPRLLRKFTKYENIIRMDSAHKKHAQVMKLVYMHP